MAPYGRNRAIFMEIIDTKHRYVSHVPSIDLIFVSLTRRISILGSFTEKKRFFTIPIDIANVRQTETA